MRNSLKNSIAVWAALALLLCLTGTLQAATKAARDNKYAILVGINSYNNKSVNPLNFAVNDAYAIKSLLVKKMGFDDDNIYVFTSEKRGESEPTLTNILFAFDSIRQDIASGGTFIFFFSGHGLNMEGESFLLTREADPRSRLTLEASSLKVSKVMETIAKMKADKIMLLIDACRTDPGGNKGNKRNLMSKEFSKDLVIKGAAQQQTDTLKVRATLYSCSEGESSFEWQDKKQGFFSYYLVQGIGGEAADANGNVTLSSLESYLSSHVPKTTMKWMRQNQTPWMEASGSGMSKWALMKGKPGTITDGKAGGSGKKGSPAREEAKQYASRGDESYDRKDYENAIAEYSRAIEKDPSYAEVYKNRSRAYIARGDYDSAIADCNRAIELDSNFDKAYYDRGIAYYDKKDYDRAIADFTRATEITPDYADSYVYRGMAYHAKHDYDKAIADYNKAIEIDPKSYYAYINRGAVYRDQKEDYDRAIADFTKAIEISPNSADSYKNRGNAYFGKNDYDSALADYSRAIEIDPNFDKAYVNRGRMYTLKGDYEKGFADLNKAIAINPAFPLTYVNRGLIYVKKEDYDSALADYNKAIALDPNYAYAYLMRGVTYNDYKKDYDNAIADWTKAVAIDPDYAAAYNCRGIAYGNKGEDDSAIADYTKAISINSKYADPYYNRGRLYKKKGDFERAIADLRTYIRLASSDEAKWINKANDMINEMERR